MKIDFFKKIFSLMLVIAVAFVTMPISPAHAAEVSHAASAAEAQALGAVAQPSNTSLYSFIGSGFLGFGQDLKATLEGAQKSFFSKEQLPMEKAVLPEGIMEFPIVPPVPTEKVTKEFETLQKGIVPAEEEVVVEEKQKEDEAVPAPVVIPVASGTEDGLAAALEGELTKGTFFGMNTKTIKIAAVVIGAIGATFLILGLTAFSGGSGGSGGSESGGSGGSGGEEGGTTVLGGAGGQTGTDELGGGEGTGVPPIPEPQSLMFILTGLFGLLAYRRFRL